MATVTVELSRTGQQMMFVVTDDGHGFDPDAEFPGHFGLKSMRQRARQQGIGLTIDSGDKGTAVTLVVGISDAAH